MFSLELSDIGMKSAATPRVSLPAFSPKAKTKEVILGGQGKFTEVLFFSSTK